MKISKLFHWLYAILMLLPFAFFVPSILYYAFNDNSTMQTVEVPKTETIAVDFNQLVMPFADDESDTNVSYTNMINYSVSDDGRTLTNSLPIGSTNPQINIRDLFVANHVYIFKFYVNCDNVNSPLLVRCFNSFSSANIYNNITLNYGYNSLRLTFNVDFNFNVTVNQNPAADVVTTQIFKDFQAFDLTSMFGVGEEPTLALFNQMFPNDYYSYTQSDLMQVTYDTDETEEIISNTDIINYAWESVWDLPLFSWTKVTFVSVPFAFITCIFGVASSSSLNYVFGYFATISIVWLLFDVILFLPLLVHRWIDKARIE